MPISVIIPAYKARRFLAECLESVGRQTLTPLEVLVIDDASPEPADDIVAGFACRDDYPPIRLLKHGVNRGQAAARNTGIRESSGEWLAFIDCDDIWAPEHLETMLSTTLKSGADLGFCPAILFDENPEDPRNYHLVPLTEDEKSMRPLAFLNRCFIITSSTLVRGETMKKVGGFDESSGLRGVEDLDCFLRLLKRGARFQMAPEATLYYRKHPESATGTFGYLSRQDVEVKRRHIGWVQGSRREKRIIMMEAYWRAAVGLWLAGARDRLAWVGRALIASAWNPLLAARWSARFLRSLWRGSALGL